MKNDMNIKAFYNNRKEINYTKKALSKTLKVRLEWSENFNENFKLELEK